MTGVSSGPTSSMMASAMAGNLRVVLPFRSIERANQLGPGRDVPVRELVDFLIVVFFLMNRFDRFGWFDVVHVEDVILIDITPARLRRPAPVVPGAAVLSARHARFRLGRVFAK